MSSINNAQTICLPSIDYISALYQCCIHLGPPDPGLGGKPQDGGGGRGQSGLKLPLEVETARLPPVQRVPESSLLQNKWMASRINDKEGERKRQFESFQQKPGDSQILILHLSNQNLYIPGDDVEVGVSPNPDDGGLGLAPTFPACQQGHCINHRAS